MSSYITTPIYYVNGDPHVGHAYTSAMADLLKRALWMRGDEVFLSTGTDEHGQKNQEAAERSGLAVQAYLTAQSAKFRAAFEQLEISFDLWVRTSAATHIAVVRRVLSELHGRGLIHRKKYAGLYCVGCEMFKRPSDLDAQGRCPDHQAEPVPMQEENYFLRIGEHQDWLREQVRTREDWIQPLFYRTEVLHLLEEPLEDLCISRPKSRVSLGIELPFDAEFVTYVWFDALCNYISNLGWPDDPARFERWWPHALHLLGKDIVKTHCVYWPILLRGLDLAPPHRFQVHGYWLAEGGVKMSKSLANALDPVRLAALFGSDSLRFFMARHSGARDAPISVKRIREAHNTHLVNNVGNLYSRVLALHANHLGAELRPRPLLAAHAELREWVIAAATGALERLQFQTIQSLAQTLLEIADRLNRLLEAEAPWALAQKPEQRARLESVLYTSAEGLRLLFELAWPVMPGVAERALANLGARAPERAARRHRFERDAFPADARIGAQRHLFARLQPGTGEA